MLTKFITLSILFLDPQTVHMSSAYPIRNNFIPLMLTHNRDFLNIVIGSGKKVKLASLTSEQELLVK